MLCIHCRSQAQIGLDPGQTGTMGIPMSASLLCIGHIALDLIFGVDDFPEHPTKVPSHRHHRGVGGMSANAAVALARLGARVGFCGPIGEDHAAPVFEEHLRREGVDTRGLRRVPGQTSSVSAIIVDRHGERMIFNAKGSALSAPGPFDTTVLDGVDYETHASSVGKDRDRCGEQIQTVAVGFERFREHRLAALHVAQSSKLAFLYNVGVHEAGVQGGPDHPAQRLGRQSR